MCYMAYTAVTLTMSDTEGTNMAAERLALLLCIRQAAGSDPYPETGFSVWRDTTMANRRRAPRRQSS
jgi:hypothetical protein